MASYMRIPFRGKNGKATAVDGSRKDRTSKIEFISIAKELNGDITKIAERTGQPTSSTAKRYENVSKKTTLPTPHNFGKKRTKVEMTPQRQRDLVKYWNETEGDTEIVSEKLGVSVATVINWGKKIDQTCCDIYRRRLYEANGIDDPESEAAQELENKIMEEGFASVLCPKKEGTGKRGRSATPLDDILLSQINNAIEETVLQEEEDKEELEAAINDAI